MWSFFNKVWSFFEDVNSFAGQAIEMHHFERRDDQPRDQCFPNFEALLLIMLISRAVYQNSISPIPPLQLSVCKAMWQHLKLFEKDLAATFEVMSSRVNQFPILQTYEDWLQHIDISAFKINAVNPSRISWQTASQWVQYVQRQPEVPENWTFHQLLHIVFCTYCLIFILF